MRITVRNMTRKEVSLAIEWAAAEIWNPGLHETRNVFTRPIPRGFSWPSLRTGRPDVFPWWPMMSASALPDFTLSCPHSAVGESDMNWSGRHPPMPAATTWGMMRLSFNRKPTNNLLCFAQESFWNKLNAGFTCYKNNELFLFIQV